MTPAQFKKARISLGMSAAALARELSIGGKWADRTIRKWEDGAHPIPPRVARMVQNFIDVGKADRPGDFSGAAILRYLRDADSDLPISSVLTPGQIEWIKDAAR